MLSAATLKSTEELLALAKNSDSNPEPVVLDVLENNAIFERVIKNKADFMLVLSTFPQSTDKFLKKYFEKWLPDYFNGLDNLIEICNLYPSFTQLFVSRNTLRFDYWFFKNEWALCDYATKFIAHIDLFFGIIFDTSTNEYQAFKADFIFLVQLNASISEKDNLIFSYLCKTGNKLKFIPPRLDQQGPHCAYYAAYHAAAFYEIRFPLLFPQSVPQPRKKDFSKPQGKTCLKGVCKLFSESTIGVFTYTEMIRVVEQTGCRARVVEYDSLDDLIENITENIDQNKPILIPYAINGADNTTSTNPFSCHWSSVFGYFTDRKNSTLRMCVYTGYRCTSYDVSTFYSDVDALKPQLPELFLTKRPSEDWKKSLVKPESEPGVKTSYVSSRPLTFFKKTLVIVDPPIVPVHLMHIIQKQ